MKYKTARANDFTMHLKVLTVGDAKDILEELGVDWVIAFQHEYTDRGNRKDLGIHIYFKDDCGYDLAYYTPVMEILTVLDKPRVATFTT
jgi:hypothetical protein